MKFLITQTTECEVEVESELTLKSVEAAAREGFYDDKLARWPARESLSFTVMTVPDDRRSGYVRLRWRPRPPEGKENHT